MAIRSNQGVAKATERLAGRSLGAASKRIRRDFEPLVRAIKNAKGEKDLKRRLGPGLLKQLGTYATETALAETVVQVGLAARVAARPKGELRMRNAEK